MWVLPVFATERTATTAPAISVTATAIANPMAALRLAITVRPPWALREAELHRGRADTPATAWVLVSRRAPAVAGPAARAVDRPAAGPAAAAGTGSADHRGCR